MAMRPQLFSGARGELKINGEVIAYVTEVSVTVNANVRAVHTFGAPNARSVEPLSTSCSVTIGRVIPVNKPDGSSVNTSSIQNNIEPIINQMLFAEDIQVELQDRITKVTVANVKNCRFTGRSLSVGSGNIASERITLMGIYDAANGNTPTQLGF
jgi:hypothetical protein